MRILIDVTSAAESPMNTGIQRVVRGVTHELHQQHSIEPLVWDEPLGHYRGLLPWEITNLWQPGANWQQHLPPTLRGPFLRTLKQRPKWRRKRQGLGQPLADWLPGVDLFLVPEVFRDGRLPVLQQARPASLAKWVAFFYDATPLKLAEITDPARREQIDRYHEALAIFDLVLAASAETRDDIEALWRELAVAPAPTAIRPWPLPLQPEDSLDKGNFPARRLLYVATLEGRKNHLTLLEAAELLWNAGERFTLDLVGRPTRHWGPKVEPEIRRLQKKGRRLLWRSNLRDPGLRRAYAECSATVFPSLMEGYGLPILESLAFGRPCLCSADGAIGEVSLGGGCLHVEVREAEALANGMRQLLNDEALYGRLQSETRDRTFPTWPAFVQQMLAS